jgi:hypothetical protein
MLPTTISPRRLARIRALSTLDGEDLTANRTDRFRIDSLNDLIRGSHVVSKVREVGDSQVACAVAVGKVRASLPHRRSSVRLGERPAVHPPTTVWAWTFDGSGVRAATDAIRARVASTLPFVEPTGGTNPIPTDTLSHGTALGVCDGCGVYRRSCVCNRPAILAKVTLADGTQLWSHRETGETYPLNDSARYAGSLPT